MQNRVLYSDFSQYFLLQDNVNVYKSSPPLPGMFRPYHLLPSAYNPFVPDSEDSSEFESFSSDNEAASA